jgi:thiopeptide-type bacteriocin biosynthesis protein
MHHGYAIMRRPSISLETVARIHAEFDVALDQSNKWKIQRLLDNNDIALALELSAPGFYSRLRNDQKKDFTEADVVALQKYLIRMGTRCTPFGAFASVSIATIANIGDNSVGKAECRLRLDSAVLTTLHEMIKRAIKFDRQVRVKKNAMLYAIGDEVRYFERRFAKGGYHFALARVTLSEELQRVLDCLSTPQSVQALMQELLKNAPELEDEEAFEFVKDLLGAGILDVDLDLSLIGPDPLGDYLRRLEVIPGEELQEPKELLTGLHQTLTQQEVYSLEEAAGIVAQVERLLDDTKLKFPKGASVHIDSFGPTQDISLPDELLPELQAALTSLHYLFPTVGNEQLRTFAQAYERRFGEQFYPIGIVLDPELGIPYGFSAPVVPWMQGLGPLRQHTDAHRTRAVDRLLVDILSSRREEVDIRRFTSDSTDFPPSDMALSANLTIYGQGDQTGACAQHHMRPLAFLHYLSSPGSANLSARFAARHPEMTKRVRTSIEHDTAINPDVIHAEIVHAPHPRTGNVLARPSLFKHRIVLTGDSTDPDAENIYLDDLYVGVSRGRPILRSRKLNCEIIPRITSAFNYTGKGNLALYQFLCVLGRQSMTPSFRWPVVCDHAAYLPRVRSGRIILAAARWRLSKEENEVLCSAICSNNHSAIDAFFAKIEMPRYFTFDEGDQKMEFDANSLASLQVLAAMIKSKGEVYLHESAIRSGDTCFFKGQDTYHSEITLPLTFKGFSRPRANVRSGGPALLQSLDADLFRTAHQDEWFYFKVYGGEEYLKALLVTELLPMVEGLMKQGRVRKWHFLRYADPDFHFRIRFLGPVASIREDVNHLLRMVFDPKVRTLQLANVVVDRYVPEVVRYGGAQLLPHVETFFSIDTSYACRLLHAAYESQSDEAVWKGVLLGTIQYLNFFMNDTQDIVTFVNQERDKYKSDLIIETREFDKLGKKYREHREFIEAAVAGAQVDNHAIGAAIAARESAMHAYAAVLEQALGTRWRDTLPRSSLSGIIHMQANRLFTSSSRPQEFVIFEFLSRAYRSVAARNK